MEFSIRPYHPSDMCALYRVCLKTGDSGDDATHLVRDEELFGHCFVGAYIVYEPDICFSLLADGTPVGYMLGTRDSAAFRQKTEQEWFPALRTRYPLPPTDDDSTDAHLIRFIHRGIRNDPALAEYPAHLHIDLLPIAQGQGWGRKIMQTFLARLRTLEISAVHLGVGQRNARGIAFYEKLGFHRVMATDGAFIYGMHLTHEA